MNASLLKRAYLPAAVAAAGITSAIVLYTVLVEFLHARGYQAPIAAPAAHLLKYAFYAAGAAAVPAIKLAAGRLAVKRPSPEETLKALTALTVVKAAAAEVPAVAGLVLFLLTGLRADFYMLAVFALALEAYNFPRLAAWEERLRADFGQPYEP
ncbi:MAG: hypothetical protein NDI60_08515 [Elusimicrobiales bacterium]|nr:hypothetical protein [Elusimicrobiales bacterium]